MEAKGKRASRTASSAPGKDRAEAESMPVAPSVSEETAAPVQARTPGEPAEPTVPAAPLGDFGSQAPSAIAASQEAFARGVGAFGSEMAGLARAGVDGVMETASGLLAARTLVDVVEVNARIARQCCDAVFGASARLSELTVRLAADTVQPLVAQSGKCWAIPTQPKP